MTLRIEPKPGYSLDLDQDALRKLVECNPCNSTQELTLDLNTSQSTICYHLKKIRKVSKLGVLVAYTLSEKKKEDQVSIATNLLSRQRNNPFLKNIIITDGKWVFYDNVQHKSQWIDKDESPQPSPKDRASWKKSYVCIVGSLQYYSF